MANAHRFSTVHANAARHLPNEKNIQLQAVTLADVTSLNWEATAGAAPVSVNFGTDAADNPLAVRTLTVYAKVDVWVAGSDAAVQAVASQKYGTDRGGADRFFVPAGVLRELPWYWDEVHLLAVAGGGAVYVEGKV